MTARLYRHPSSYKPPLAFGGHCFTLHGIVSTCARCGAAAPTWATVEGWWPAFMPRWCLGVVVALDGCVLNEQLSLDDIKTSPR